MRNRALERPMGTRKRAGLREGKGATGKGRWYPQRVAASDGVAARVSRQMANESGRQASANSQPAESPDVGTLDS